MKRILSAVLIVFFCISCEFNGGSEVESTVETIDASVVESYDVSSMKGDTLYIKISEGDSLRLVGMDAGLISVLVAGDTSSSRNASRVKEIFSDSENSIYVIVPDEDGSHSLSAAEIGVKGRDVIVKVRKASPEKLTSKATIGVFSYRIPEKAKTPEAEKGESSVTYWKYYKADLTSDEWKAYKDSEVVLAQSTLRYSELGGGRYSDSIGILKDGEVYYTGDFSGLIDLSGLDELKIYSFLNVSYMSGDVRLNSYIILPEEVKSGGDEVEIKGFPHVFKLTGLEKSEYGYDIIISGIGRDYAEKFAERIYVSHLRKTDGTRIGKPVITNYEKEEEGGKYTLTFHFDEFPLENLILDFSWMDAQKVDDDTVFGKISLRKTESEVSKVIYDLKEGSYTLNLKAGQSKTIYYSAVDDKDYRITFSGDYNRGNLVMVHSNERGSGIFNSPFSTTDIGRKGSVTILSLDKDTVITCEVKADS